MHHEGTKMTIRGFYWAVVNKIAVLYAAADRPATNFIDLLERKGYGSVTKHSNKPSGLSCQVN